MGRTSGDANAVPQAQIRNAHFRFAGYRLHTSDQPHSSTAYFRFPHSREISDLIVLGRRAFSRAHSGLPLHVHGTGLFEITFVVKGRADFVVNKRHIRLNGGDVCLVFPGETHAGASPFEEAAIVYYLAVNVEKERLSFMDLPEPDAHALKSALLALRPRSFPGSPKLLTLLDDAIHALQILNDDPLALLAARTSVLGALLEVIACSRRERRKALSPRFKRVLALIEERITNPPTVEELASEACMSASRLRALFRDCMGTPLADYMLRKRIDAAKELLLRDGAASITHIALDLGFSSSQYFSTVFRRYTNVTPREFAAASRGAPPQAHPKP